MNRLSRTLLPILALITLAAVVIGIPVLLITVVGRPLPSPLPTSAELGDVFAGRAPIPADYLISGLAIVMWLLWIQILWATLIETAAAFRGRLAARARMVPGVQLGVAKLVTTATLLATSFAVRPVAAGPLTPVASAQPIAHGPGVAPRRATTVYQQQEQPDSATAYLTEAGDTWWDIAERHLGSGTRWKEIRTLNLGRTMADGTVISGGTDMLRPQWRLLLPARPTVSASAGPGGRPKCDRRTGRHDLGYRRRGPRQRWARRRRARGTRPRGTRPRRTRRRRRPCGRSPGGERAGGGEHGRIGPCARRRRRIGPCGGRRRIGFCAARHRRRKPRRGDAGRGAWWRSRPGRREWLGPGCWRAVGGRDRRARLADRRPESWSPQWQPRSDPSRPEARSATTAGRHRQAVFGFGAGNRRRLDRHAGGGNGGVDRHNRIGCHDSTGHGCG